MKKIFLAYTLLAAIVMLGCNDNSSGKEGAATNTENAVAPAGGQENVKDEVSQKDVVKVAVGSPDHTTLVAALKHADLVTSLSNAGPFTVFAPTDEAFKKLPAGTLDNLMKAENKDKLIDILQYHVFVSALQPDFLANEQTLSMVNGSDLKVTLKDGKPVLNGNVNIVASVPASNGIVYVIDGVLLPPSK